MTERDLPFLTAAELALRYRGGEVSPVEVAEAFLARIERYRAETAAYITVTAERARADAKAAETALRAGNDLGPLHGIPVALKDLCDTAGIRTTSGAAIRTDYVPQRSARVAAKLARAGTVLLGKTNMVEFAFGPFGLNPHFGTPPNPWDAERVPGGSSSGSGVAVAAGLATAAIGTDTGGSVRIPAAFCGITGLKTTVGWVSRAGVTPLSGTLDSVGPMVRCVEDAALVFSAIAGPDPADPSTLSCPTGDVLAGLKRTVAGMRVGVVRAPFFEGADPEVVSAVEAAVQVLSGLGVLVEEMAFPEARQTAEEDDNLVLMRTGRVRGAPAGAGRIGGGICAPGAPAARTGRSGFGCGLYRDCPASGADGAVRPGAAGRGGGRGGPHDAYARAQAGGPGGRRADPAGYTGCELAGAVRGFSALRVHVPGASGGAAADREAIRRGDDSAAGLCLPAGDVVACAQAAWILKRRSDYAGGICKRRTVYCPVRCAA